MTEDDINKARDGSYSSPPCLAHKIDPAYFDPLAVDPKQASDVARWRKAKREELRAARKTLSSNEYRFVSAQLADQLERVIQKKFNGAKGLILSAYWPIKGELDLRPLMIKLHRVWTPETKMVRGVWNIPVPPADAAPVRPDIALAPLVGWDDKGYRLGYGGGYFDRTLAALKPRPFVIGVGFASAQLPTIFPQPHDIALQLIVTELSTCYSTIGHDAAEK